MSNEYKPKKYLKKDMDKDERISNLEFLVMQHANLVGAMLRFIEANNLKIDKDINKQMVRAYVGILNAGLAERPEGSMAIDDSVHE